MKIITEENLKTWRRHLHQNPELSLKEYKTKLSYWTNLII